MKRIMLFTITMAFTIIALAQSNVDLLADSIRMFKKGGLTTVVIRGVNKDSINFVLTNIGNGIAKWLPVSAAAASGIADVMAVSNQIDTFSLTRISDDSGWLYLAPDSIYMRRGRWYHDGLLFHFKGYPGTGGFHFDVENIETFDIEPTKLLSKVPFILSPSATSPIAMVDIRNQDLFDTGVYGESSGSSFSNKWGGTFVGTGTGNNMYGVEGIASGGSQRNASFRAALPATYGATNWGFYGVSLASYFFQGPIITGVNSSTEQAAWQLENFGSWGADPDSIPIVPSTTADLGYLVIDTNAVFGTTNQFKKVAGPISGSATLDFGSTGAGNVTDLTITVTGAASGDIVTLGVPGGSVPTEGTFFAWVSATDTVTVRFANNKTVGSLDPSSGTFKVKVYK